MLLPQAHGTVDSVRFRTTLDVLLCAISNPKGQMSRCKGGVLQAGENWLKNFKATLT
jgi:hypothetical protein